MTASHRPHRLRPWLWATAAVVLLLVAASAGVGWFFSRLVVLDNESVKTASDPRRIAERLVFSEWATAIGGTPFVVSTGQGHRLPGWEIPAARPTADTVVIVHGFQGNKEAQKRFVLLYRGLGYNTVVYDQVNHGEASPAFTSAGVFESRDLAELVAWVRGQHLGGRIGVHGTSMGAATALLFAAQAPGQADFIAADCSYTSFYDEASYRLSVEYPFIPPALQGAVVQLGDWAVQWEHGFSMREAAPIKRVASVAVPLFFACTRTDKYIPPAMTEALFRAAQATKQVFWTATGGHAEAYDVDPEGYTGVLKSFLVSQRLLS